MKKFLFIYFIYITAVQILFTLDFIQPLSMLTSTILANASSFLIGIFDNTIIQQGVVLTHSDGSTALKIDDACNGLEMLLLLFAAILAYPATTRNKLIGLASCLAGVQMLNLVRIVSLFYTVEYLPAWFDWTHEYFWRFAITLDVLLCFSVWVFMINRQRPTLAIAA